LKVGAGCDGRVRLRKAYAAAQAIGSRRACRAPQDRKVTLPYGTIQTQAADRPTAVDSKVSPPGVLWSKPTNVACGMPAKSGHRGEDRRVFFPTHTRHRGDRHVSGIPRAPLSGRLHRPHIRGHFRERFRAPAL